MWTYMSFPGRLLWFDHLNNTRKRLQTPPYNICSIVYYSVSRRYEYWPPFDINIHLFSKPLVLFCSLHQTSFIITTVSNSMKPGPSREASSRQAAQEIPKISWNPKVYWHTYSEEPAIRVIWIRSIPHPVSLRSILIIYSHLRLGLPTALFPSGFLIKIFYTFSLLSHAYYMPCPYHIPWLDYCNFVWRGFVRLFVV
jgi:hypothetical protein